MRFSSTSLQNLGNQSRVISRNGATVSISNSGEITPVLTDFDFGNMVSGSLTVNQYNTLYSYIQGYSGSSNYAATLTTVLMDVGTQLGLSPRVVAEMYTNGQLTPSVYAGLNSLRPKTSQEELLRTINNRRSFLGRNINP